ncbi:MAG: AraC family transcriptional regulator, partial [Bacteroidales bacterium]|nr:AraC family transcriptional regulator [Bacteroidales bacterium]
NKNFCQLVHYYRVREAMRIYAQHPDLTITQLSRRVGFNSMTTFNTAFGRNTGYTPA